MCGVLNKTGGDSDYKCVCYFTKISIYWHYLNCDYMSPIYKVKQILKQIYLKLNCIVYIYNCFFYDEYNLTAKWQARIV